MVRKLKRDTDGFIREAEVKHDGKYDYSLSEYTGVLNLVKIICPIHGVFEQSAGNHLTGRGCPTCGKQFASSKSSSSKPMSKDSFIKKAKTVHGDAYDYSNFVYVNNKTHGLVKCNTCMTEWSVRPDAHIHSKSGCPNCNKSRTIYTEAYYKAKGIENHPCKIYLLEIEFNGEKFLKLGLTKGSVRHRFRGFLKQMKIDEVMVFTGDFFSLYRIEQELLSKYSDTRFIPIEAFRGHTECLEVSVKNELLSELTEMLAGN